ncbi:MAG: FecR family protein [Candidatus Zipacnadales bacterium]
MRRIAVLAITAFILIVFSAILFTNSLTIVQQLARVSEIRGFVELKAVNGTAFKPLLQDATVRVGSVLRTGADGYAVLWWPDNTTIRIEPGTELTIEKCLFNKRNESLLSQFSLHIGHIWVDVVRSLSADSKFEIHTPTATAGVRGTTFAIDVSETGTTEIFVYKGTVEVNTGSKSYSVNQGHALTVTSAGNTALRELTDGERTKNDKPTIRSASPKVSSAPPHVGGKANSISP